MTQLTNNQLNTVRSPNQSTDLYLGIYEPNIVFAAQINSPTITKGAVSIPYDNVTSGTYLNVQAGMTAYIGLERYGDDIGRVRVRSITSGTITVAIDNSIDYLDNLYVTIRDFYEVWSVFPRATVNDSNIITYFKDYDVSYSNQNSVFRPTPIMGGHYFGFANDTFLSGSYFNAVYFTATGSYSVDSNPILSYDWIFPSGCVPKTYNTGTPDYIRFPDSGNYTVKCTVSSTNTGTTQSSYRHVALFDRPGRGTKIPISDWKLKDITGDFESGWTAKIEVGQGADRFRDGYLVGIWCDDFYNGVRQSFGGYPGREHILFVGYVNKIENVYNAFNSTTTITLKGIFSLLQNKEMFSVSLESNSNPADWTQLYNMTIKKILDHYLRYHTTVILTNDFQNITTETGDYPEQYEDISKGEISNNLSSMLKNRLFATLSSDKQGRLFTEVDLNLMPTGTRPASVMTFTDYDWIGDPKWDEVFDTPTSSVLLGGVSYDYGTNSGSAYLSRAPGLFPAYIGKSDTLSGLTLSNQQQLNILSGLYFGKQNNRINNFEQDINFNMRNIDIIPQEFYVRNIATLDTFRRIRWVDKRFIPRRINYKFENGSLVPNIQFEAESYDSPGVTIEIPVTAPRASRPPRIPRNSRPPRQPGTSQPVGSDGSLVYVATSDKIARTRNFNSGSPNWSNVTGALAGQTIIDFILDPFNPKNKAWVLTNNGVYKTNNLDSSIPLWSSSITAAQVNTLIGGTIDGYYGIKANITTSGKIMFVCKADAGGFDIGFLVYTTNDGTSWTFTNITGTNVGNLAMGGLDWGQRDDTVVLSGWSNGRVGNQSEVNKSINGGTSFSTLTGEEIGVSLAYDIHIPYNDNPSYQIFYVGNGSTKIYKTVNGGTSWSDITPSGWSASVQKRYMIHSYTEDRQIMMAMDGTQLFYSSNGGTSWTLQSTFSSSRALGGFPYNGGRTYRVRASNITSANLASDPAIWTSINNGAVWVNQTGDWASAIGNFNTGIMIVPVWVDY